MEVKFFWGGRFCLELLPVLLYNGDVELRAKPGAMGALLGSGFGFALGVGASLRPVSEVENSVTLRGRLIYLAVVVHQKRAVQNRLLWHSPFDVGASKGW